jgi:hypothetical protein
VDHCLTQLFCGRPTLSLANRDCVGGPIVLQNDWVIDGNVCGALFEVTHRIATRGHHVAKQLIRFGDCTGGAIDKAALDSSPRLFKTRSITRPESPKLKFLDSLRSTFEPGFSLPPIAAQCDGSGVFSLTELST